MSDFPPENDELVQTKNIFYKKINFIKIFYKIINFFKKNNLFVNVNCFSQKRLSIFFTKCKKSPKPQDAVRKGSCRVPTLKNRYFQTPSRIQTPPPYYRGSTFLEKVRFLLRVDPPPSKTTPSRCVSALSRFVLSTHMILNSTQLKHVLKVFFKKIFAKHTVF